MIIEWLEEIDLEVVAHFITNEKITDDKIVTSKEEVFYPISKGERYIVDILPIEDNYFDILFANGTRAFNVDRKRFKVIEQ